MTTPGEMNDFASLQTAKRMSARVLWRIRRGDAVFVCLAILRSEMVIGQLSLLKVWSGGKGVLRSGNSEFGASSKRQGSSV
jgi:hypothetical protein